MGVVSQVVTQRDAHLPNARQLGKGTTPGEVASYLTHALAPVAS